MDIAEEEVRQALHGLEEEGLTSTNRDSRVAKFEHQARTVLNLRRDETAILCLLLLRGPQTPGELRSRADRMYSFDDIAAVESTLSRLASHPLPEEQQSRAMRPIVAALPRQPGSRELRYMHLLSGPIAETPRPSRIAQVAPAWEAEQAGSEPVLAQKVAELEAQMEALRVMIARLETRLESQPSREDDSNPETAG
jgi:uncharacterized protein YceH (UPF0502 family)